jgi:signal transduction histidine kinase
MARKTILDRFRMRTTLLVPLLFVSFGWTVISLLILRVIVQQQTQTDLTSDLRHSVTTYQNLQNQRSEMLSREAELLAALPTLKALMTSNDLPTINDAGAAFWKTSKSDLFALFGTNGELLAVYANGAQPSPSAVESLVQGHLGEGEMPFYLAVDGRLYEVATQPLIFGGANNGTPLGFLAVGYAIDEQVAREVSQAAEAEVAFSSNGSIVATTLSPKLRQQLHTELAALGSFSDDRKIKLGSQSYLTTAVPLSAPEHSASRGAPQLVVLKSFQQGQALARRVNQWVAFLGLLALCAGAAVLLSISRSITRPLAGLVEGARALGEGDYAYRLSDDGAEEVRELSRAFERMRVELQRNQKDLLTSERLATIGRMASSISHDLRHYLSAMYANAEFMSDEKLPQPEREELFQEVRTAVLGMTELLDSLLLFTQTGRALHPEFESVALIMQRALGMLRAHPAVRDVKISLHGLSSLVAYVDANKLGRAVYNLLLNGCEAARRGTPPAAVTLTLAEDESFIRIHVSDTGPGVPEPLRRTMFLPFVSEGKESGTGLGLTLAEQVAAEHGGYIHYGRTSDNLTLFSIVLPKSALGPPPPREKTAEALPAETVI